MQSELDDLVEFLHHGNTQIRQIATETLVPYSTTQPTLFKRHQLTPITELQLLIKDYPPIASNALTILVNLSADADVREKLVEDGPFLDEVLRRVSDAKEQNADLLCMLLANLAKSIQITHLITLQRDIPKPHSTSLFAVDQLLDRFVQTSPQQFSPTSKKSATYDHLAYLFADLASQETGRTYLLDPRSSDSDIIPLTKLIVFTEHSSIIRRRGVANTIKNVCFSLSAHARLLASEISAGIGLLPYLLLPLMGPEEYSDEDSDGMLDECQLLPGDKRRESEAEILVTHLESLLLLTTEREGRTLLRDVKVYPIVRQLHLAVEDEAVREGCDRLVQVLMRDEQEEPRVQEIEDEEDEDEQIIEVL